MTDQPGRVLEEAAKLFVALNRWMRRDDEPADDDVWGRATREPVGGSHIATGPECQYCPICRTIAVARTSGTEVVAHVMDAGQSLIAAMRETVAAYERSGPARFKVDGDSIDIG